MTGVPRSAGVGGVHFNELLDELVVAVGARHECSLDKTATPEEWRVVDAGIAEARKALNDYLAFITASTPPVREVPQNAQQEPPYPGHDTVTMSIRYPLMTCHLPTERCRIQEPHPSAECGEFAAYLSASPLQSGAGSAPTVQSEVNKEVSGEQSDVRSPSPLVSVEEPSEFWTWFATALRTVADRAFHRGWQDRDFIATHPGVSFPDEEWHRVGYTSDGFQPEYVATIYTPPRARPLVSPDSPEEPPTIDLRKAVVDNLNGPGTFDKNRAAPDSPDIRGLLDRFESAVIHREVVSGESTTAERQAYANEAASSARASLESAFSVLREQRDAIDNERLDFAERSMKAEAEVAGLREEVERLRGELIEIGEVCEGQGCGAYWGQHGDGIEAVRILNQRLIDYARRGAKGGAT